MRTVIATSLDAMGVEGTREQGLFLRSLACEVERATGRVGSMTRM